MLAICWGLTAALLGDRGCSSHLLLERREVQRGDLPKPTAHSRESPTLSASYATKVMTWLVHPAIRLDQPHVEEG